MNISTGVKKPIINILHFGLYKNNKFLDLKL